MKTGGTEQSSCTAHPASAGSRVWMRACNTLFLMLVMLVLASCSARFLYDQLDRFVVWKVNGYVSLTKEQKAGLSERLSDYLDSVRRNELPQLAELLAVTATDVEDRDVTPASLDEGYNTMLALTDRVLVGAVPLSAWLLSDLSDEQVDELFANLEELNQEMYEDYSGSTEEERRKNRNRSAIKMTQRFTGRLKDDQKELITESLAQMQDASEQWIEYQRLWQLQFRELIESKPPRPEFEAELERLFIKPREMHSPEFRDTVDSNREAFNTMLVRLIESLSDKQRDRTVNKLLGYEETLLKLSEDS